MKRLVLLTALIAGSPCTWSLHSEPLVPQDAGAYSSDLLARVRVAATIVPGAQPSRINYVKFAESHRPLADIIEGGSQANYISARTAFQWSIRPVGS